MWFLLKTSFFYLFSLLLSFSFLTKNFFFLNFSDPSEIGMGKIPMNIPPISKGAAENTKVTGSFLVGKGKYVNYSKKERVGKPKKKKKN